MYIDTYIYTCNICIHMLACAYVFLYREREIIYPYKVKIQTYAGHNGTAAVIPALCEAEIRKITVPSQPRQKFVKPHLSGKKPGVVPHTGHPSYSGSVN
jgi:hypothetical protein